MTPIARYALPLACLLALPVVAAGAFPVDPGISAPAVERLSATSARVSWTTAIPATGGVLQYSKQHQFAVGLDPFTLRVVQEQGAARATHEIVVSDIDASDEWRFLVSYQPAEEFKYDSPLVYPFRAGTVETAAPAPAGR